MASPDKDGQNNNMTPTKLNGPSYTPGSTNPDKKKQQSRYGDMMNQVTPGFNPGVDSDEFWNEWRLILRYVILNIKII